MIPLIEKFSPVGELAVRQFERIFGHSLPSDYFDFLCQTKGWWFAIAAFVSVPGVNEPVDISQFYVVTGQWERGPSDDFTVPNIGDATELYSSSIPDDFLVIASGEEGQFVMDFREESYGEIYFRDTFRHEINDAPFLDEEFFEKQGLGSEQRFSYVKVAKNFNEFTSKIELSYGDR